MNTNRGLLAAWALRVTAALFCAAHANAFSLLGPHADWMQPSNGFRQNGEIGGPMNLGEGYRWNVPVVSYGFDQSFVDYFGSNGVAAVEQAIQLLNDLPPASEIVLTNYSCSSIRFSYAADNANLYDLKSATLTLLLEELGLAKPTKYVYTLTYYDPTVQGFYSNLQGLPTGMVGTFNFDPESLERTPFINGEVYTAYYTATGPKWYLQVYSPDPDAELRWPAAAGFTPYDSIGTFLTGLTYDDMGGLKYLLSSNNFRYEFLLPGITGVGSSTTNLVEGAFRPGIEKVTFVRQPSDVPGNTLPLTNQFTDTYISNGITLQQQVQRVIQQPDFLFLAGDLGVERTTDRIFARTGTANWTNLAGFNGSVTNAGPGVIRPPIQITFQKAGWLFVTQDTDRFTPELIFRSPWGVFDGTTNSPVSFPCETFTDDKPMTVRLHLFSSNTWPEGELGPYSWQVPVTFGKAVSLESGTNLLDWVSLVVVTNYGARIDWTHYGMASRQRFFRVVPAN